MPVFNSATSDRYGNNVAHYPSDASTTGASTVSSAHQLKIFSDIVARIIVPRKIHVINDAFHFEILVKSQKIVGFRVVNAEEWSNFKVESEFAFIEDPKSQPVQVEVRKIIDAAASSLDDGKLLVERLQPHEKSQISAQSAGIYPADAMSAETTCEKKPAIKTHSASVEEPLKVEKEVHVYDDKSSFDSKNESAKPTNNSSPTSSHIEEFFEKLKDKSKFAFLQNRNGDKTIQFGVSALEETLPANMLSKLNEWNQLVSASLSDTPKFLTSFGPSKNDPVMIMAVSNSQCLIAELSANKFGVAIALWNSILKKA